MTALLAVLGALSSTAALGMALVWLDAKATTRITRLVDEALEVDPDDAHPGLVHSWRSHGEHDGEPVDICTHPDCGAVSVGGRVVGRLGNTARQTPSPVA